MKRISLYGLSRWWWIAAGAATPVAAAWGQGDVPTPPVPVIAAPSGEVVNGKIGDKLDDYLSRMEAYGFNGAVLYGKKGRIFLQKAYGYASLVDERRNTVDTLFDLASVSKQFTAAAILKLQMEGKLLTDDPITRFFPSLGEDKQSILLFHLLSHTSGLPRDIQWGQMVDRDRFIETVRGLRMESPPGEQWSYSNIGFSLLAAVVEVASGEKYEDYLRGHLFKPAGLEHVTFLQERPAGDAPTADAHMGDWEMWPAEEGAYAWGWRGAAGILASVRDLARWDAALRGDTVLDARSRAELYNEVVPTYCYGWFARFEPDEKRTVFFHGGNTRGFECHFERCLKDGSVLILLCNDVGKEATIRDGLISLLHNAGASMPAKPQPMPPERLAVYAGEYQLDDGVTFRLTVERGALVLRNFGEVALAERLKERNEEDVRRAPRYDTRMGEALHALSAGDAQPLEDLAPEGREGWGRKAAAEWELLLQQGGGLGRAEVLGTIPKTLQEVQTFAALESVKLNRTEVIKLEWYDGELVNWDRTYPAVMRFIPVGDEQFISYDISSEPTPRDRAMRFVTDENGKPTTVAILIDFVRLFAKPKDAARSAPGDAPASP